LDPGFIADPYPTYQRLLERDPLHRSALTGALVVTRYQDVDAILRDQQRFRNELRATPGRLASARALQELTPSLLNLDPPDHSRLRGLVNRAFSPRQINKMEDSIRETAHALLDEVGDSNEFDLISNLATLLPMIVIAKMIGVPTEDRERFKKWSHQFARVLEPNLTTAESDLVFKTADEFRNYFAPIIERRRGSPSDDLVSELVRAEENGQKLTTEETEVTLRLLLVAGNETTTNLIGNGLRALLQFPEQLDLLRNQPQLIENAIEELLRYDPPVQLDARYVPEEVKIGDKVAKGNSRVVLLIGAANRDSEQFDEPNTLDITRPDSGNISFGRGIHHCLGAPLARLEARIAFEVLLDRFDQIQFTEKEPVYKPNIVLRGLHEFPVRVHQRNGRSYSGSQSLIENAPGKSRD
tara:strand:- start:345 stop:1580 length:1236 start_codon:yes stop_codon:yes gene_type:complete